VDTENSVGLCYRLLARTRSNIVTRLTLGDDRRVEHCPGTTWLVAAKPCVLKATRIIWTFGEEAKTFIFNPDGVFGIHNQLRGLVYEPHSGFAYHQQLTLHRCDCFWVVPEFLENSCCA